VKSSGLISENLLDNSVETLSQRDNIEELLRAMHEFCILRREEEGTVALLPDFLSEVSLLTDQDTKEEHNAQRVTLMTVHASKGLEFNHVFVVGLEEELFPSARMQSECDLEEERRLLYVAITRARETCHLSYAKTRFRNGKTAFSAPSRFIKDIDPHYLDMPDENTFAVTERREFNRFNPFTEREKPKTNPFATISPSKKLTRISAVSSDNTVSQTADGLYVGARVTHKLFGIGNIVELQGDNIANIRAVVDFDNVGEKSLLLKFAKLELME
jgi:DNA helicase-2/ATP-dependent DNA helicase PcrA